VVVDEGLLMLCLTLAASLHVAIYIAGFDRQWNPFT